MIAKGTKEYKMAQELANNIQSLANTERCNNNSYFGIATEDLDKFLSKIRETNTFASKIAETIDKTINPYGYKVANVSSKQAWILASTAVELNISL